MTDLPTGHMTFWEHLQELRVRLIRSALIIAVGFGLTYAYRLEIWQWAQRPFLEVYRNQAIAQAKALGLPPPTSFQPFAFTDLAEPFFSLMRLSFWAAAVLVSPLLFHQLWAFIKPGLYPKERRWGLLFVVATSACFLAGAAFAYLQAFQILGHILFREAMDAGLRTNLHVDAYLDLFIYTLVGTGLVFELPVLIFFLARFRLVTAKGMLRYWRHATLGIVVAAAFLTPGDLFVTTVFFSGILLGLYLLSVLVAWAAAPRTERETP